MPDKAWPVSEAVRVLVPVIGTGGDLMPAIALGRAVAARGYDVHLLANPYFGDLIQSSGLGFHPVGERAQFLDLISDPECWTLETGFRVFAKKAIYPNVVPVFQALQALDRPGRTVVAAFNHAYGARFAPALLGQPTVRVFIQPAAFRGLAGPGAGPEDERFSKFVRFVDTYVDSILAKYLPNWTAGTAGWAGSGYVALFPRWFAPLGDIFPAETVFTGFPLYDGADIHPLPDAVSSFLESGPPPVLVFLGSNQPQTLHLFEQIARALAASGRRGLLVCPQAGAVLDRFQPSILAVPWAPFGPLLPRVTAVVHHGGIGTIAQALAAGVPQVIVPYSFETPENADCACRLGVAQVLAPATDLVSALDPALVSVCSPEGRESCRLSALRLRTDNPFERAIDTIATLAAN